MTDTEITIEVAKLDGWEYRKSLNAETYRWMRGNSVAFSGVWLPVADETHALSVAQLPSYLTSRDAIVPVIEKHPIETQRRVQEELDCMEVRYSFLATPHQLCIALLKATGQWRDQ